MTSEGHPFTSIPVLQKPDLLSKLKDKVTTEATRHMTKATGVPPHVEKSIENCSLLQLSSMVLEKVNNQQETIGTTIFEALEQHAINNGNITHQHLRKIFESFKSDIKQDVAVG